MKNASVTKAASIAIVTGASAGIGTELARLAAADGYRLLLVARRADRLQTLAAELEAAHGLRPLIAAVDLSERDAPDRVMAATRGEQIDMLINNAGFGTFGPFASTPLERTESLLEVNITALTRLTRLCLPGMIERGSGLIMNVASIAAFMPGPGMAAYYASKAYVLHLSEALDREVRDSGVIVSALCPGPTRTEFQHAAGMSGSGVTERLRFMTAADVARIGYRGLKVGRPVVVTGLLNKLRASAPRLLPRRLATNIVARIQASMK